MASVSLWTASVHHPGFRCGGWASVRVIGVLASGFAGGARATSASRMALSGLVAGLRDLPPATAVTIHTAATELSSLREVLAGRLQPDEDLDLWAQIAAATSGRTVSVVHASAAKDPLAFAAAWAELAMDKAKMSGPFSAAIPRGNLAKASGLEAPKSVI